eukprot:TRINITY_DN15335_c1_g1_i1.p1 TRINITY_DN15335_c1_g1~~TRINITY_DN15335_c1_g1_i1.p1  ORF type:complete len:515 (+),score=84.30 TRINITY_DN15335_c1_g1_i1:67-1611(+)
MATDTTSIWSARKGLKWKRDVPSAAKRESNFDDDEMELSLFESVPMMELVAKKIDERIKKEDAERTSDNDKDAAPLPFPQTAGFMPLGGMPACDQPFGGTGGGALSRSVPPTRPVAFVPAVLPPKMRLARERIIRENKRQSMKKELFLLQVRHQQLKEKLECDDLTPLPDPETETEMDTESQVSAPCQEVPHNSWLPTTIIPSQSQYVGGGHLNYGRYSGSLLQSTTSGGYPSNANVATCSNVQQLGEGVSDNQSSITSVMNASNSETVPTSGSHHPDSETDETESSCTSADKSLSEVPEVASVDEVAAPSRIVQQDQWQQPAQIQTLPVPQQFQLHQHHHNQHQFWNQPMGPYQQQRHQSWNPQQVHHHHHHHQHQLHHQHHHQHQNQQLPQRQYQQMHHHHHHHHQHQQVHHHRHQHVHHHQHHQQLHQHQHHQNWNQFQHQQVHHHHHHQQVRGPNQQLYPQPFQPLQQYPLPYPYYSVPKNGNTNGIQTHSMNPMTGSGQQRWGPITAHQ